MNDIELFMSMTRQRETTIKIHSRDGNVMSQLGMSILTNWSIELAFDVVLMVYLNGFDGKQGY